MSIRKADPPVLEVSEKRCASKRTKRLPLQGHQEGAQVLPHPVDLDLWELPSYRLSMGKYEDSVQVCV